MKNTTLSLALFLFLPLYLFLPLFSFSQSPSAIPYQAIVRNSASEILSDTPVSLTIKIHETTVNGAVVYQESQSTTTNAQGWISISVGQGTNATTNFAGLDWTSSNKFLQLILNAGSAGASTDIDLGTQQLMSVPYALYANQIGTSVSTAGDTLFVGDQFVIVPGISAANPQVVNLSGLGAEILPDNTTCQTTYISVNGCNGQDSLLYNNTYYDLAEIGGQCWFAENLATSQYNDGTAIPNVTGFSAWGALSTPAYCWYNNNLSYQSVYGGLYNYFAVATGNLCPTGWHVASDCDWMYMENHLGLTPVDQSASGWRGAAILLGGDLKNGAWTSPNLGASNSSGFTALPGGFRMGTSSGTFSGIVNYGFWWTSSNNNTNTAWSRGLGYNEFGLNRDVLIKKYGASVRCIKE
jgi:uncharacterized protein (TIGR02145 family)